LTGPNSVFGKLLETSQHGQARTFMLEIYVQEKDWQKAIDAAQSAGKGHQQTAQRGHCPLSLRDWHMLESAKGNPDAAAAAHLAPSA
jgi:lipopolysaccharide assembly protein B